MGNPFEEDSDEIIVLDTKEVMPQEVAQSIMRAHEEGKKQHSTFVHERLENSSCLLTWAYQNEQNLSSQQ